MPTRVNTPSLVHSLAELCMLLWCGTKCFPFRLCQNVFFFSKTVLLCQTDRERNTFFTSQMSSAYVCSGSCKKIWAAWQDMRRSVLQCVWNLAGEDQGHCHHIFHLSSEVKGNSEKWDVMNCLCTYSMTV